jgi:hypothetical protein
MAADLWGDLLGAESAVTRGDIRWLTPLPLWSGILAGPLAWAFDLTASYAMVKWVCHTNRYSILTLLTIVSLGIVMGGAFLSWTALTSTANDTPTDGGRPRQRARFMALLGLALCALFALQILAGEIPRQVLDACH